MTPRCRWPLAFLAVAASVVCAQPVLRACPQTQHAASNQPTTLADLRSVMRLKAKSLENSSGMRQGFAALLANHHLAPDSIRYSDYVVVRLYFEATRDAGFWNLHWAITDKPPNSDNIWRQWQQLRAPLPLLPTATAECDELSALFAFLVDRAGVKTVGLFWPYPNHTVAVWVVKPATGATIRVVVPTSQIFLEPTDDFGTTKFDPWHQKTIYEYTRRDVPDSFSLPPKLFSFFVQQVDKYAAASNSTLLQLRYLRSGVLQKAWTPEQAAQQALQQRAALSNPPAEDTAAFDHFVQDMRLQSPAH